MLSNLLLAASEWTFHLGEDPTFVLNEICKRFITIFVCSSHFLSYILPPHNYWIIESHSTHISTEIIPHFAYDEIHFIVSESSFETTNGN